MDAVALSNSFPGNILVELEGCDRLELFQYGGTFSLKVVGCAKLLALLGSLKSLYGSDIRTWVLPEETSHEVLLMRELILKARGEWVPPYQHEEICHCRAISTRAVDQQILLGAHSVEVVMRRTSASSACGTCRPDVQSMIDYRRTGKLPSKTA